MVTKSRRPAEKKNEATRPLPADTVQTGPDNGAAPSNQDALRRLYASALRFRMLAERAPSRSGGSSSVDDSGSGLGDEGIVAGATLEVGPEDTIVAALSGSGTQVRRGVSAERLFSVAEEENGNGASVARESPFVWDPFNLGTGLALAHRLEKKRNVVVVLCAEPSTAPDRWHEAMKFAGVHKLPVVYVLKSSSAFEPGPRGRTPVLEDVSFMTRDGGFPAIIVDSNDAVGVWRVAYESIHRARNGAGPTLIECDTQFARSGDPLVRMEHYMRKRGAWDDEWRRAIADAIEREITTMSAPAASVS